MGSIILKFIKSFGVKYFGTVVMERLIITLLKAVVERTDSKLDDEIFKAVFEKVSEESKK